MTTNAQRLIFAVRSRNHKRLRELISRFGNASQQSKAGRTALHAAAEEGDLEAVQVLVEAGCDVNGRMGYGQTPLQLAAGYGSPRDLVDLDLDRRPCLLRKRSRLRIQDKTLADAILFALRRKIPELPPDFSLGSEMSDTIKRKVFLILFEDLFVVENRRRFLDDLQRDGVNVRELDADFADFLEGEPRFLDVARYLLQNGADALVSDNIGNTSLHAAAEYGTKDMVELILLACGDPTARIDIAIQSQIISLALIRQNIDIAVTLLRFGFFLDKTKASDLFEAASNGRVKAVGWLIDNGMPVDLVSEDGKTA